MLTYIYMYICVYECMCLFIYMFARLHVSVYLISNTCMNKYMLLQVVHFVTQKN